MKIQILVEADIDVLPKYHDGKSIRNWAYAHLENAFYNKEYEKIRVTDVTRSVISADSNCSS